MFIVKMQIICSLIDQNSVHISDVGRSTLVGQRPMKSLLSVRPSVCLFACPSVTKCSEDWFTSFF